MAKNYKQDGKTIEIVNDSELDIASGDVVVMGGMVAVAITHIAAGEVGDGFAEGVFLLPKLATDDIAAGAQVALVGGLIQLDVTDAVIAGHAWEASGAGESVVAVKING